ncbi:MAG: CoA transferase [Thermoproteus sp. AZ2]|jgi:crotonobetainyl-CoA:carnitine CoA-transferase CaiB-like acyl-CoA transferase|uniref:CoA transferase n=1 Tax=Thermoproteus sp. AZ2 TaxID=1609232 RepID=A0ACC6V0T2_9CREN|nr:MAG: carnitine dehydratase [Thermoproteus sp. AZ2]
MSREEALAGLFSGAEAKPSALEGVRVVEICGANYACRIAGSILGELGAEVYTVPDEDAKDITPHGVKIGGVGIPYLIEGRGKREIPLADVPKLLPVDILIDGLGPGKLHSMGLGYPQLSEKYPDLIYVAISQFGHYGEKAKEYANMPDSDLTAQAYNGYMAMLGNPSLPEPYSYPIRAGVWLGWAFAGAAAALGALAAYWARLRTGRGQFVDVAINEVLSVVHPYQVGAPFVLGKSRQRSPTIDANLLVTYTTARAKDGFVALATVIWPEVEAFFEIIGRPDLANRWREALEAWEREPQRLRELEAEVFAEVAKYSGEDLVKASREKGRPPIAVVKTLEYVAAQEHWRIRRAIIQCGDLLVPGTPFMMSETPGRARCPQLPEPTARA